MASSYGKRTWFHQIIGIISLLAMISCFLMLDHKPCQIPLLPREELSQWTSKPITGTEISTKILRQKNQSALADDIENFIQNYYDQLQIFQIAIGCWSMVIMILGLINIVPKHEDLKVMIILLLVLIMGFAALFAFYTAFMAFHKPCRAYPNATFQVTRSNLRNLHYSNRNQSNLINKLSSLSLSSSLNNNQKQSKAILQKNSQPIYMLEFRSIKDKRPVNVFEDEDETMIRITLINSGVGFILLCSDFLFFFDSRQHMIEWRN